MARPAAPMFRAAPPMQRPAMAPHAAPRIAAPSRPAAPRIVAPRPEIHRAAPPQRPAMARRPEPHIAAPSRQGAPPPAARLSRGEQIETRAQQRAQRIEERRQVVQERQRGMLTRQSTERQSRIERMQQRVQQLQTQKPEGLRAQRAQQRLLQTENRRLQREQRMLQSDQARLQRLGPQPSAERSASAAAQAAARGRFSAQFRSNDAMQARVALTARENAWAPRHAWRRGHRAAFVAWLGPVFWPYAYSDIFSYTFWPYAYDPGYWAYAYDDFVDTVFWGADSPYSAYARYPEPGAAITDYQRRTRPSASRQTLRELCSSPDEGVTSWPIASITRAVQPTPEQRALLDELKAAAAKAANAFKDSCADSYPMTPPGRLRAMTERIRATLEAVRIVRPALEQFYNSLNDEQKARFNALGPNIGDRSQQPPQQEANAQAERCGDPKSSLTQLPIERIEAVVRPAGGQKEALDRLSEVTRKAVAGLQSACPDEVPLTPIGRLEAMEQRLKAMLEAADWVQESLDAFYATLSSEQKARFNTMRRVAGP
ncbi:Spy/CpxP family protein refolding chaperone [Bradyrhizobium sp. BWA-3-5]|uniref:Spy/CpxP family protein refolding chaperone n=1 Tax=Bradyrhizobium sp. BWA-3-5 TaxID=3080013 RepID=UPI00293E00BF|nr:Spy/CpxP family protein refolding chaperone [Bradyrhizobium sp. BWA-3-5]WOH64547.1 Spy/CpxP family protein refolding chaperone [Bradyrhizobium sp. BWA-3-5]